MQVGGDWLGDRESGVCGINWAVVEVMKKIYVKGP
jgi:hypothetical protein